ncbi:hypothetical protein GALMADRAFT_248343 [Galerina marginata CBS 339.88]|uniref:Uncharacterized protein n=1 Tax=Galerina marginata (strain CBS 339.88) TaxID=685588 RepID=A0A067T700_GALM3|nr:hypothetical protein GALMADRAFT_248343 [Galerina marginata CBS 339.88]
MSDEDILPEVYKYFWSPDSDILLQDFLTKFKPSMVQNDGTKPWIWVRGSAPSKEDSGVDEATKEAAKLLKEVADKIETIKNDESIPLRANKKTGAKSKKEVREQVQAEATEQLKEISVRHGYVSGKWLIFASAEKVDQIWSGIASSLVSGPLHDTSAYLAKVSTSSQDENPNAQHLICIYLPDVYDKAKVAEVMKVLLRNHGVNLSGVKSDLYTAIGIDSKHASGIPSTIWKNAAILPEKESKELKDAYFADLASKKAASSIEKTITEPDATPAVKAEKNDSGPTDKAKPKPKPKLKKKVEDDPFASDDDDPKVDIQKASSSKPKPIATKRAQVADTDDEEEQPKKKKVARK